MGEWISRHKARQYAQGALLTGLALSFSSCLSPQHPDSSAMFSGNPVIRDIDSVFPKPQANQAEISTESIPSCKPVVLFLGGLGQEAKDDHKARPFLPDSIAYIEKNGGTFETVSPKNAQDPAKEEWVAAIQKRVDQAHTNHETVILAAYSMGVAAQMQLLNNNKDTENAADIAFSVSFSGRDMNPNNASNRPQLKEYPTYFKQNPSDPNSQPSLSDEDMKSIGNVWKGRILVAGEEGDTIVPEYQTRNLARLLSAPYISLSVMTEDGRMDNHLGSKNASTAVLEIFQTALIEGCKATVSS